jgi:hypothetical protein
MINEIIRYAIENPDEVIKLGLAVIGIASVIVRFTPTPKDDAILAKIKKIISTYLALNPEKTTKVSRKKTRK